MSFEVRTSADCFWVARLTEPCFARDICTDTTTLVSHSRMDAGQARLTANAGRGFDAGPATVWRVRVCEKRHDLEAALQHLSGMTNAHNYIWKIKVYSG